MVRITPHSAQSSRPLKAALALLTFLSIEQVLADQRSEQLSAAAEVAGKRFTS